MRIFVALRTRHGLVICRRAACIRSIEHPNNIVEFLRQPHPAMHYCQRCGDHFEAAA